MIERFFFLSVPCLIYMILLFVYSSERNASNNRM
jgi:hypothetical protein